MKFRSVRGYAWLPLALSAAWGAAACGSLGEQESSANATNSSPNDATSWGSKENAGTTIVFEPATYVLPVLSQGLLSVRITPPSDRIVTFALVGETLDASLESEQSAMDATGLASVSLITASEPTTFSVRASLDRSLVAEAIIHVERNLTGSVQITSKYAGTRKVGQYSIALYPGKDCTSSGLSDAMQDRISFSSSTMPASVPGVPFSKSLAVVVDGDEVVHGCATAKPLTGQADLKVEVPLEDVPIDLTGVNLNVSMTTTDGIGNLVDAISAAIPDYVAAFVPGDSDLVQLLNAMESVATGSLKQEFSALRIAGSWDQFVLQTYGENGREVLRGALRRWLINGVEGHASQPIAVRLSLGSDATTVPKLCPTLFGGFDAATQLNMKSADLAVAVAANDQLNWSGRLGIPKADYFGALALRSAMQELPEIGSIAGQLARRVDCDAFAANLDGKSIWKQSNARTCAQSCLATLCQTALESLAQSAKDSATLGAFDLLINASGTAQVDAHAQPISISGSWVGAFLGASSTDAFKGTYASR